MRATDRENSSAHYEAVCLRDGDHERLAGRLSVDAMRVNFTADGLSFSLPLHGLQLQRGGSQGSLLFLSHANHPGLSVFTRDFSVLRHPHLAEHPSLHVQIASLKRGQFRAWALGLGLALAVVAVVAGLVMARHPLARLAAQRVPLSWEEKLGALAFEQVKLKSRMIDSPEIASALQKLTDRLQQAVAPTRYRFQFHVVEDPSINAFAMPGGFVVIHSKLLLAADSAEELAGVLAHEMAHVTEQHTLRQIISSAGLFLMVQTLIGDMSGILAVLADGGGFLLNQQFSREFESEADAVGLRTLEKARVDPRGMLAFFRKMAAESATQNKKLEDATGVSGIGKVLDFVSTHPASEDRLHALEKKMVFSEKSVETIPLDYLSFKQLVTKSVSTPPAIPTTTAPAP